MLLNRAPKRANWYLPNKSDKTCCFDIPSNWFKASAKSLMIPMKFPLFWLTMASRSMPNLATFSRADFAGLISDARPDLRAFAPSAAETPPSRIAVSKTAMSSTVPPRPLMTGATLGMASERSSMLVTVWFSTAFRKLIF